MLVCLSLDHHRASFDLIGQIEQHAPGVVEALSDPQISRGSVVLATCNRFEAYLDLASTEHIDLALERILRITGVDSHQFRQSARIHHDLTAASHLFSVTSGLESVVIGEGEIAGQVRRALEQARQAGSTTSTLERVFQLAARTSRDVKHRTGVQTAGRSLVRLALAMSHSRIGDWASSRTVLVGTGMYAGASLAALRARGARDIGVYSPSGRAEQFALSHDIRAITESELETSLAEADLVVATSLAREPILTKEVFLRSSRPARAPFCASLRGSQELGLTHVARPRLVIDLGLPRNIAPDVVHVSGIELLNLETIALHAPIEELSAEAEARNIVEEAVEELAALQAENDAVPALVALRTHVNEVLIDEIQRMQVRLRSSPTNDEVADRGAEIESALRHFAGRLLHTPSIRLREMGRAGRAEEAILAVESLFPVGATGAYAQAQSNSSAQR